jgi:hypothetical protein
VRISFCVLGACLALISCSKKPVAGVEVDAQLKGYILPKSKVLAGISLDQIRQTEFYKRHQAQLAVPTLDNLSSQIGIDPRRDVATLLASWNGTDLLTALRGNLDSPELKRHLAGSIPSEKYNDLTLYGDGKRDVMLLPKGIALVGNAVVLKKAVPANVAGADIVSEDLQMEISRLDHGAQIWMVSSGVIPVTEMPLRSDTATNLSNISDYINGTATGITVNSGLAFDSHISCISEEGAQRVHDALRGLIGLARLSTPDGQLEQLKIWDSIHVDKSGKEVHVTAQLTPELADKLIALLPSPSRHL